jgi:putative ABC transport system permease protein
MLDIALPGIRSRLASLLGAFAAVAVGVGLIATVAVAFAAAFAVPQRGPQRFAGAPVVVQSPRTLSVTFGSDVSTQPLPAPAGLPASVLSDLAAAGRVVPDRTFYAQVAGGPAAEVGHGWSSAALGNYRLVAGAAPQSDTDIVLPRGTVSPGASVLVYTAGAARRYTVSGLVAAVDFESAVFFSDDEAARLSPQAQAAAFFGSPDAARGAVGTRAQVLTGADRRSADPDVQRDHKLLLNVRTLLGVTGGFTAFVVVFVVASTFAFGVALRRREFALLRLVGATPRQVRRSVLDEAALLGAAGSVVGCVIGVIVAPLLTSSMVDSGLAPLWFHAGFSLPALVVAFVIGVGVAVTGALAASARAGRVAPIEALQDAVIDRRVMTPGRWWLGLGLLFSALMGMGFVAFTQPKLATVTVIYLWVLILPIAAVALLAPVAVPPIARLVTWPLSRLRGAGGMLVRENALTSVRRTAATAAPVLLTVGLTLTLLGAVSLISGAEAAQRAAEVKADWVVTPDGAAGVNSTVVGKVNGIDGADVATVVPSIIFGVDHDSAIRDFHADAVDPAAFAKVVTPTLSSGSFAALTDDTIVVGEDWKAPVGTSVRIWLADGTPLSLRVVGTLKTGSTGPDAYFTPKYAGASPAAQVYVKARPGADPAAISAALHAATDATGATVLTRAQWVSEGGGSSGIPGAGLDLDLAIGITLLYSAFAIVNTMVNAAHGRIREVAVLRLAGATPRQVIRVVIAESLLVAALGVVLALVASALNFAGMLAALDRLVGHPAVSVPWLTVAVVAVLCTVLALLASVLSVRVTLRSPAVEMIGFRE